MRVAFDRRRRTIVSMLNDIPGVTCPEPEGAFYAYPSVKGVLGKTINGTVIDSSLTLADVALDVAEVAVVPGEAFGTPGYLRMSYALGDDDLVEGVTRLGKLHRRRPVGEPPQQRPPGWTQQASDVRCNRRAASATPVQVQR